MKTTFSLGMLLVLCLSLIGCGFSKDAEVNAFMNDFEVFTNELATKIRNNPTEAGVDEAQKYFDANKPNIQSKWNTIKDAREIQVTADTKKKMEDGMTKNVETMTSLADEIEDPDAAQKFLKLATDYSKLLQP